MSRKIDISFDFHSDTPPGKDPRLVQHFAGITRFSGANRFRVASSFELVDTTPVVYLHHQSEVGEFFLANCRKVSLYY